VACKGLAEALAERGNEIDVVTSGMKDLAPYEELEQVRVHRVRCRRRYQHYVTTPEMMTQVLPSYRKALQLIEQNDYSINHTHFIVPSGLTSYLLWRKTGLPYVITLHGSDVPGYNPDRFALAHVLVRPVWRRIIRHAKCLISPSHFMKDLLLSYIDARVEVIPHGIEFPKLPDQPKRNRIAVVTRMFERKGVQFFLQAIDRLSSDWEICIAGDGPYLPTLREMARGIDKPVQFLGFLSGERLLDLYQSAKIFVFPSIRENFPVVLLEAMNAGCAVITTNSRGCAEVVQDAGIKVAPKDIDGLRNALHYLINDEAGIEELRILGHQRISTLSPSAIAAAHEDLFAECAK
jgi:glycosyltransferase involved in cell wall biosynthesis